MRKKCDKDDGFAIIFVTKKKPYLFYTILKSMKERYTNGAKSKGTYRLTAKNKRRD